MRSLRRRRTTGRHHAPGTKLAKATRPPRANKCEELLQDGHPNCTKAKTIERIETDKPAKTDPVMDQLQGWAMTVQRGVGDVDVLLNSIIGSVVEKVESEEHAQGENQLAELHSMVSLLCKQVSQHGLILKELQQHALRR